MSALETALRYIDAGFSIIPIRADGSKAPVLSAWKSYQECRPTKDDVYEWFVNTPFGIAIIGGRVSNNLEIIDFDDATKLKPWAQMLASIGLADVLKRCVLVQTPTGGWHVYFRCESSVEGNTKLAFNLVDDKREIAIETRGEGGYVLAPGCPAPCHPTGKTYAVKHGDILNLPTLTTEQLQQFEACARSFDAPLPPQPKREIIERTTRIEGLSPWDDFDRRGDIRPYLSAHGWTFVAKHGDKEDWARPGKEGGTSATIGYCSTGDIPLFYVFSSNAHPFSAGQSYGPYNVYRLLEHSGDSSAAATALKRMGYGDPTEFTRVVKQVHDDTKWLPKYSIVRP